jgi:spore coat protein CotH
MKLIKVILVITITEIIAILIAGCEQYAEPTSTNEPATHPQGWTDETHSNDTDPNYEVVFPQDKVNQLKITIMPDDWEAMQANMAEIYGEAGQEIAPEANLIHPKQPDNLIPPNPSDVLPEINAQLPSWASMTQDNPMWIPATIEFNGLTWTHVGVRYKGNSSLTRTWREDSLKMPFKLDFDEFEDEYPEVNNQRFYGFKQLSLSNAFNDITYMHDVITANILDEAGLVASKTAYYYVTLDYGEGPVNLGLYIMIEVIDDTVIDRFYDGDSGNIYEGDGRGVSLATGTYNQIQASFLKENNEEEADWSDIEELYNVLHSNIRSTNPEAWRSELDSVFNVDVFLRWLAISAVIQHWDTYGSMPHNFYLYHDPDTGLLTWISWDHNQVLEGGGGIGAIGARAVAGIRPGRTLSLSRDEVTDQWPLIRYLLDDPVYYERYTNYIEETINGAFNPDRITEKCRALEEMIEPYATQNSSTTAFTSAVQELIDRVHARYEAAAAFLAAGS